MARVDRAARTATQANHTATHLLHAALRERLGTHVRQAGSYVGPDKLRFDFTHGERLSPEDLRAVEDRVNEWVLRNDPVRAAARRRSTRRARSARWRCSARSTATSCGWSRSATASYSRELCGGTHVRSTAEIGVFKITCEGSSASNVRRIEAITGPEAVALLRRHDDVARDAAAAAAHDARAARRARSATCRPRRRRPRRPAPAAAATARWTSPRSPARAEELGGARRRHRDRRRSPTPRRCSTSPTASRTRSATRRSCSARPRTAACTSSRRSRRRSSSAA